MKFSRLFIIAVVSTCLCAGNLAFANPQDKPADKAASTEQKTRKAQKSKKPVIEKPKPGGAAK